MRHAIGRTSVPGDHLDSGCVETGPDQIGCRVCIAEDVGAHALRLSVDIYADDRRLRHGHRRTDNKAGLGSRTARAVHDGRGPDALKLRLLGDLHDRRCVGDGAQGIGNAVRDAVGPAALLPELVAQRLDCRVAVSRPRHVMQVGAEQAVEQRIA
jgi:hypothetical protein